MDLVSYEEPAEIERIWRRLEEVARPPYALSWGWIENWRASLDRAPALTVVVGDDGVPLAAAFEEMPVLRVPTFPALGVVDETFRVFVDREIATPHVDLETVRAVEGGYLSTRPAVMRAHLLHAQKQLGPVEVEAATDADGAHAMFDALLALEDGFDNPLLRRLIDRRAPHGELQLLRVRHAGAVSAYFYNVTFNGHVAYQRAGFAAGANADLCHAAAIEYNAARGAAFYELHPDDARLATGESRHLVLRIQRRETSKLAG